MSFARRADIESGAAPVLLLHKSRRPKTNRLRTKIVWDTSGTEKVVVSMADKFARMPHDHTGGPSQQIATTPQNERVRELTWALLDDLITEEEMTALNGLLKADERARSEYLRCIQLHTDLQSQFAVNLSPTVETSSAKMPVIGLLPSEALPFGLPAPPAEDVKS
jgi:hypothetical protein